jgi:NADH-quinone oxidoreductase subunit G
VWFLRSVPSVCVGCATGCNSFTDFDPRSQKVHRYRPRENAAVNQHWMCDEGMLDYRRIHEGRVLTASVSGEATSREAALAKATALLTGAQPETSAVVLSAEHSQEDNFALLEFAKEVLKTTNIFVSGRMPGTGDDVLRDADKNPNSNGVKRLTLAARSFAELVRTAEEGKLTHVVALGSHAPGDAAALKHVKNLIAICSHEGAFANAAKVILPAATWAEVNGTYVNRQGLAQETERAITPRGDSRPGFRWVLELAKALDHPPAWYKLDELRAAMRPRSVPPVSSPAPSSPAPSVPSSGVRP